jgi:hypothetical protein
MNYRKGIKLCLVLMMAITAGIFASGGQAGDAQAGKTYTLKMSTQLAETSTMVSGFKAWARRLSSGPMAA